VSAGSGRGVTVGLVDSGVFAHHPHVGGRVIRSVAVGQGRDGGSLVMEDLKGDVAGHGTACAGVIHQGAPEARLVSVRVLDRQLRTTHPLLAGAIRWCAGEGMDVINLSLGTVSEEALGLLEQACHEAVESGAILVAAAGPERERSYPAGFGDMVLGVDEDPACGEWEWRVIPGAAIPLRACGRPRRTDREGMPRNFRGSSFAAARISALAARYRGEQPDLGAGGLLELLAARSAGAGPREERM